jgi:hypothetical protein
MPGHEADIQHVADIVHYVIAKTEPGKLGQVRLGHVKLNAILWYADLEHYRWHGAAMTGLQEYVRAPYGPSAPDIARAVGLLVRQGRAAERTVAVADYSRRDMHALRPPDMSALSAEQIHILDRMIAAIAPLTAAQLIRLTHDDPLWRETAPDAAMSIATGSIISRPPAR